MAKVEEYAPGGSRMSEAGVYLECSSGTIVDMVRQKTNAKTRVIPLCSSWDGKSGKIDMIHIRRSRNKVNGFVHPIKMGNGWMAWDQSFDMMM